MENASASLTKPPAAMGGVSVLDGMYNLVCAKGHNWYCPEGYVDTWLRHECGRVESGTTVRGNRIMCRARVKRIPGTGTRV